jgi:hypothetical protein
VSTNGKETHPVLADSPELRELVGRARQGDVTVLPRLKEFLDAHPQVWEELGDLARHAREALVRLVAGDDLLVGECVRRDLAALEAELAGPSPSPLERILVQRIVLCRLQTHKADIDAAALDQGANPHGPHAQRRQDAAHKRLLAAVKQLAVVRKLLTPSLPPITLALPPSPTNGQAKKASPRRSSPLNRLAAIHHN